MPLFTKKPVTIEAVEYTGENFPELLDFTGGQFRELSATRAEVYDYLHDSWIMANIGDFIIKGPKGEFYPILPDVFADSYDAA